MMEETTFDNGLTLRVSDESRILSGDLHLMRLVFTLCAPLDEGDETLHERYGTELTLTRVVERPAVHGDELDEVREEMRSSWMDTNRPYLGHPEFVERFKIRALADLEEERAREVRRHG